MARPIPPLVPGESFVLLDDARGDGAGDARLYVSPVEIVIARDADAVPPALSRIEALATAGHHCAGYIAYEAGLALEPHLAPLAVARSGADGPLVWFGAFAGYHTISTAKLPEWLAEQLAPDGMSAIGPLDPQLSIGGFAKAFAALHEAIVAGDIYQANLTFPLAGSWRGDPLAIYAGLRDAAGAGYGGLVHDGHHWLVSLSPELFFEMRGDEVTVRPMKGTRARGLTLGADLDAAAALAASAKDRAENLMIVDLLRNDLSRVAVPGSVRVEDPFAIETYPTLHQMVTTVRARLTPGRGVGDLLRALFPCGSITGAPKIRAMELIDAHERDPRGPYCGAIGRIDPPAVGAGRDDVANGAGSAANGAGGATNGAGGAAFNVAIRTLRLTPGAAGAGRAVMGVGAALVADSACLPEWRECLAKGGFLRQPITSAAAGQDTRMPMAARFDLIETMHLSPEGGIALLERHLARLSASAHELGFACDRHALRNAIQALCFEAERASKLRLMLARSGAYSLEISDLPPPLPQPAPCIALPLPLDAGDWRLRHKTSDRSFYEAGLRAAQARGASEALFVRDDGLVTEGCFTSIFVARDGVWLTPPAELGLLPGVLRAELLEAGRAREAELTLEDLAGGFSIGSALRGLMPATLLMSD